MRLFKLYVSIFLIAWLAFSCMDDEQWSSRNKLNIDVNNLNEDELVFISNEGNFMYGNASLSVYNKQTHEIINDIFYKQNGVPLGDVAQSMQIHDGLLYVVVNNSGKIYVLNMGKYPHLPAYEYVGKVTGLTSPRYIHFLSNTKAYVTDLYAKAITVFNPQTLKVTGQIDVNNHSKKFYQHPTEQMVKYGKFIFTNCWSYDNKILVIDSEKDQVIDSITVGLQPTSMVMDKYNKIWTVTDGGYEGSPYGHEPSSLWRIDAETRKVEHSFYFEMGSWASEVKLNGTKDTLFYINGGIWRMPVISGELCEKSFIPKEEKLFYGINIDPVNSDVYAIDAIDYVQPGVVYRYSAQGISLDTMRVGIIPGEAIFY